MNNIKKILLLTSIFSQVFSVGDDFAFQQKPSYLIDAKTEAFVRQNHSEEEADVILAHMANLLAKKTYSETSISYDNISTKAVPQYFENYVRTMHSPEEARQILQNMENYLAHKELISISMWKNMLALCENKLSTNKITNLISTTDNKITICDQVVSVESGYSQEMVDALYKISGKTPPPPQINETVPLVTNQPQIITTSQQVAEATAPITATKPPISLQKNVQASAAILKHPFWQAALNASKNQQNFKSPLAKTPAQQYFESLEKTSSKNLKPLIPAELIAHVKQQIDELTAQSQTAQNVTPEIYEEETLASTTIEVSEEDNVIFKILEELYSANKIAQEFIEENYQIKNLHHLDLLQRQVYAQIGLSLLKSKISPEEQQLINNEKQEFENAVKLNPWLTDLNNQLISNQQEIEQYTKNQFQNSFINSTAHYLSHINNSLRYPEIRQIPEEFTAYESLPREAAFTHSRINEKPAHPLSSDHVFFTVQKLLGQDAEKHFVVASSDHLYAATSKISTEFRKYLSNFEETFENRINSFAVTILPKLNATEKIELYNNLLRARDFQKQKVLPAIDINLSNLKYELGNSHISLTTTLSNDLTKAHKWFYLQHAAALAQIQFWQARENITYYEECAKITLESIKKQQRKVQKISKILAIGYFFSSGYVSSLKAEGDNRQRQLENYRNQKNRFEINSNYRSIDRMAIPRIIDNTFKPIIRESLTSIVTPKQEIKVWAEGLGKSQASQETFLNQFYTPQSQTELVEQHYAELIHDSYKQTHARIDNYVKTGNRASLDGLDRNALEFSMHLRQQYAKALHNNDTLMQQQLDNVLQAYIEFAHGFSDELIHQGTEAIKNLPIEVVVGNAVSFALQKASSTITIPISLVVNSTVAIHHIDHFIQDFIAVKKAIEEGKSYESGRAFAQATIDVLQAAQALTTVKSDLQKLNNNYFVKPNQSINQNQNIVDVSKQKASVSFTTEENIVNQGSTAILKDGYYEVNGFKFTEYYYKKLWGEGGRPAPSLIAMEILASNPIGIPDQKQGFFRYECGGWELIYNPITKEIWHLQQMKKK